MTVNYFKETDGPDKKNSYKLGGQKKKERNEHRLSPIHYMTDHLELYKFTEPWELQSTQMLP